MTSPTEPFNGRSLVDILAQSLAARIAQGQYRAGDRLPTEAEIARQWCVRSALAGAREGHLVELLGRAGLRDVVGGEVSVTRRFARIDDWWHPYTLGVGPAGSYLAKLDAARGAALRKRCRTLLPDGPFEMTAVAWAARGVH
jgi:hypothetical protein